MIAGGDITADLVRSNYGIAHFVLHGRLDGWFPRFMLGHEEFLFNGPGVTWAVALIRALTFGAVKALAIVSIAAEPLAVAYLARLFGLDRLGAGIAGVLALVATVGYGLGLEGLFVNGLLSHQVGAIPFFVSFGAVLRAYDEPTRRRCVIAGAALALLAITHLISMMILAVMLPIALLFRLGASTNRERWRGLRGVIVSGLVALGLGAFWVLPFLAHRDLHGPIVTWGTDPFDERIASILRGQLLYQPLIVKLVMVAWLIVIVRVALGHREHLVLLTVPALYLVIADVAIKYPGPGDITLQLANRGLGYAGVIALFPVAALVALGVRKLGERTHEPLLTAVVSLLVLVVAVAVTIEHSKQGLAGELTPATPAFRDAAAELATIVPAGARFSLTRDYPAEIERVGVIEPARWLAWASGVDTLNAFNPESSQAGAVAYTADAPNPGESIDDWVRALRRLGVADIVVDKPVIEARMVNRPLVQEVWKEGPVAIFQINADSGARPPILLDSDSDGVDTAVRFSQQGAENLRWAVQSPRDFVATIAVAWSPKWHAEIDGRTAPVVETYDGIMQVNMPVGEHTLTMRYRSDTADRLGELITLVTLLGLLAIVVVRRRRPNRPGRPAQVAGRAPTR